MNALLTQQKQTRHSRLPLSQMIPGWVQVALFGWMICWGNHPLPRVHATKVEYVAVGTARIDYSKSSPEQSDGRAERERASQTDFATAGYYFAYGTDGRLYGRYTPVKNQNIGRDPVGRVTGSSQSMSGTSLMNESIAWNTDGTQSGNSITRNGSVSASDSRSYGYNLRGELLLQNFSPSSGQNGSATYQFDGGAAGGLGLRTGVTLGTAMSGVTAQSYGTFARLGSMSVSGSLTNNSVGTPVAQTYDAAGNVTTRTAGGSTDTLTWDAFGQLVKDVRTGTGAFTWSAIYDGLGWRGHYIDPTGFYYMGARNYAPDSGTFLSPDPFGHSASMDLYSYCDGDPVNQYDADGRLSTQVGNEAQGIYYSGFTGSSVQTASSGFSQTSQNASSSANLTPNANFVRSGPIYIDTDGAGGSTKMDKWYQPVLSTGLRGTGNWVAYDPIARSNGVKLNDPAIFIPQGGNAVLTTVQDYRGYKIITNNGVENKILKPGIEVGVQATKSANIPIYQVFNKKGEPEGYSPVEINGKNREGIIIYNPSPEKLNYYNLNTNQ